ncbi:disulfide bond formation protein B [Peribacillus simplex]|uniref:disulfide bond formation protein B n=1 Tax=Peribacillus simplex TaxID=1478 RepID=UPI003CEE50DE
MKQYEPCSLCWYQRINMYPFTIILGIAIIRKDYWISFYTMILSESGAFISTYHNLIQKVSSFLTTPLHAEGFHVQYNILTYWV